MKNQNGKYEKENKKNLEETKKFIQKELTQRDSQEKKEILQSLASLQKEVT